MAYDLRYNLINTFRTIDAWRVNVQFNISGALLPGFKRRRFNMGLQPSFQNLRSAEAGHATRGPRDAIQIGVSELQFRSANLLTREDPLQKSESTTDIGIQGQSQYIVVAESTRPGAPVMVTRAGTLRWELDPTTVNPLEPEKQRYHLKTAQGLFVLRSSDVDEKTLKVRQLPTLDTVLRKDFGGRSLNQLTGDELDRALRESGPTGMIAGGPEFAPSQLNPVEVNGTFNGGTSVRRSRDGWIAEGGTPIGIFGIPTPGDNENANAEANVSDATKRNNRRSAMALALVPQDSSLNISPFGGDVYSFTVSSRQGVTVKPYSTHAAVANGARVFGRRLEQADPNSMIQLGILENQMADFVFKNLSTMLQEYNNSQDQLLNLVR